MTNEKIREAAAKYIVEDFEPTGVITEDRLKCYIAGAHSRDEEIKQLEQALAATEDVLDVKRKKLDQLHNPWVSVEERLPEESQIVFVHMQGGSFDSAIYTNGAFERSLQLKFGMKDEGYTIISWEQRFKSNITHWMPIPTLNPAEQLISGLQEMNKQFEKGGK